MYSDYFGVSIMIYYADNVKFEDQPFWDVVEDSNQTLVKDLCLSIPNVTIQRQLHQFYECIH